jgi:hypothetical protein
MYSKTAMELYSKLLIKVADVSFAKKALPLLGDIVKSHPSTLLTLLGLGAAVPGAFYVGRKSKGVSNEWDKLKYGLGGLGVGLSAPLALNSLLSPYKTLPGLGFTPSNSEVTDFSSL